MTIMKWQLFLFITQTHHVTLDVFCSLTDMLSLFQTPGGQANGSSELIDAE